MQLQIKYFGLLAEVTNCQEETVDYDVSTVSGLLEALYSKYPELRTKDFKVAQNNEIVTNESTLTASEIALLPPFSGG